MNSSVETIPWTVMGANGSSLSTSLPRVIRNFKDFAVVDVYTGDIDPTYWGMYAIRERLGHDWAVRYCVAMLAYYHTGTAAKAADYEDKNFWDYLNSIYQHAPRASERRHFRGAAGLQALVSMERLSPNPNTFFDKLQAESYLGVKKMCERHLLGFGSYFHLKICDYMDRCLDMPLATMEGLETNLPTLPAKAVKLRYPHLSESIGFLKCCREVEDLGLLAPPLFDRPIGFAEVETILCDWKRAKSGSSWIGADVLDKRESLAGYGENAATLASLMPPTIRKGTFEVAFDE